MTSVAAVVDAGVLTLADAGFAREEARRDAVVLARGLLQWTAADWLVRSRSDATAQFMNQFASAIERRGRREPVAYILGEKEFYGRPFRVTHDTLIPRPETEGLVDAALDWLRQAAPRPTRVIDVGTGSGCIAITLALECRNYGASIEIAATDTSNAALAVARENANRLGAPEVEFRLGNLLAGTSAPLDVIVSNPPYVAFRDRETLPQDVVAYEPATALFAGEDGLDVIDELIASARAALTTEGALILEVGAGQAGEVGAILRAAGFESIDVRRDLQGVERVVIAQKH